MPANERKESLKEKLNSNRASLSDAELLELLLLYSEKADAAGEKAKTLLDTFGSLNGIICANPAALIKNGLNKNSAILIALSAETERQIGAEAKNKIKRISTANDALTLCENILSSEPLEKMILITLDGGFNIINIHTLASLPSVKSLSVNPQDLLRRAIFDNAAGVILAHNHPHGLALPSNEDVDFTIKAKKLLSDVSIELKDHIIVGQGNSISLRKDSDYKMFFK